MYTYICIYIYIYMCVLEYLVNLRDVNHLGRELYESRGIGACPSFLFFLSITLDPRVE